MLSMLFSRVLVPKAVREELFKRRETKNRIQSVFENYAFFERCDNYDRVAVAFLLAERRRAGMRDRGEVEAVVQASQFGAAVVLDDAWGRGLAHRYGLDFHGTLWVFEQIAGLELISSAEIRSHLGQLRRRGTRLPWDLVEAFLERLGESPINDET